MSIQEIQLSILFTILGAILGAAASIYITWRLKQHAYKVDKFVLGRWYSTYQSLDYAGLPWVDEEVIISVKQGKLVFTNTEKNEELNYVAHGDLFEDSYIIGEWKSKNAGAHGGGIFSLLRTPKGGIIYGYWLGANKEST
ncbi:MAG: hypothetical protein AAGF10_00505, partial [Verrucomicrobiota bacterium]